MNQSSWPESELFADRPSGLSDAALLVDRAIRSAMSRWRATITSERTGIHGQFRYLAEWWKRDTEFQSSPTRIAMHPAYQRIIGMGAEVLPLILRDLDETRASWFWALRAITGEDPVAEDDRGYIDRMTSAWIRWGTRRNLV